MTYYNAVFDDKQYMAVTKKAADYWLATADANAIPLIVTDIPDAKQYTHVVFAEAGGTSAGLEWVETGEKMQVRHDHEVFELPRYQGLIQIRNQDIANFGASLIADKHAAELEELVHEVDEGMFHGPKNATGFQLQEGFLGQMTPLPNLTAAAGHDCSVKGEIWHVIKEMIEDIPLAMRQKGPDMVMYICEKAIAEAQAPDRIYQDMVEWDFIDRQFISGGVHGRKIGKVIITNKILGEAGDGTALWAGANGTSLGDTLGTHGRICIFVPDKKWLGRVVSRGFSLIGEEQHMLHVDQLYGYRGRVCVFNGQAMNISEQLTF